MPGSGNLLPVMTAGIAPEVDQFMIGDKANEPDIIASALRAAVTAAASRGASADTIHHFFLEQTFLFFHHFLLFLPFSVRLIRFPELSHSETAAHPLQP